MIEKNAVTPEGFDALLNWLDDNREAAGEKYEKIRRRLIRLFSGRGCFEAEELADEAINRVTLKLPQIIKDYQGEPTFYFHGVANFIYREWLRKQNKIKRVPLSETDGISESAADLRYECLETCLQPLSEDERRLIIGYYRDEKKTKIENRRKMAEVRQVSVNALQIKVFRIRRDLQKCVQKCVAGKKS